MKKILQGASAALMTLCLPVASLCLLLCWMTTAPFADIALGGPAESVQQARIDREVAELNEAWQLTGAELMDEAAMSARSHRKAVAAWWSGLFTGESDPALPVYLTYEAERALTSAVMADEGFAALVPEDMRRVTARDEVAYALDEAVCRAVLPLRRSVTDLTLQLLAEQVDLTLVRPVMLTAAGVLLLLATVCGVYLRRRSGAALLAAAVWMAALSVPVWALDFPAMLAALNDISALACRHALAVLAACWYPPAALLALTGWLMMKQEARPMTRQINHITVHSPKVKEPLTLAVCADLHDGPFDDLLPVLADCDAILILGDLVDRHKGRGAYGNAVRFLQAAPEIAPTFYAIGNHEWKLKNRDEYWPHVEKSRVTVLDNRWVAFGGVVLGALSSAETPDASWLPDMAAQDGFRLLMCHHPEYYPRYIQGQAIDLTLSGHAHGGQVCLWGHALYAPGQGILPRLTSGWYDDGRLLVSRGLTNATWAPRINTPCELIILHLEGED